MIFQDRSQAGVVLAQRLAGRVRCPCVVAAIPRGGVVVALPIAERLGAPIALVFARKLTSPSWPELAFGALDEDGFEALDDDTIDALGIDATHIQSARARTRDSIHARIELYRAPPLADLLPGRGVVIVDDGLATGLTVLAAIRYARRHDATDITVAVPCASSESAARIEREADRLVTLVTEPGFRGVSQYYVDFSQVSDEQVTAMLATARTGSGDPVASGTGGRPA
jgi:putative phosphoribosyl transferase